MRIQYEDTFHGPKELTVQEAFAHEPFYEETGRLEEVEGRLHNTKEKLARLGVLLQQKGLLQAHEILDIAGISYTNCRLIAED